MKHHHDPVTGDQLTSGEYISWLIQGIIRRWAFLGVITAVTILVWATNNSIALTWWNLGASYLALVIESVVGLAMYGQTRRDAVTLREVRTISRHIEVVGQQQLRITEHIEQQFARLQSLEEVTGKLLDQRPIENHSEEPILPDSASSLLRHISGNDASLDAHTNYRQSTGVLEGSEFYPADFARGVQEDTLHG